MKKDLSWYVKEKLLMKTPFISRLTNNFLDKARSNLVTMSILHNLSENTEAQRALNAPADHDPNPWVVAAGYYAMYMAASAALAKVGYRSKNHTATVLALDTFFVKKKLLEPKYLKMIENARIENEQIEQIKLAKDRREIAQYSVTKKTTKLIAEKTKDDAYNFVERMEELVASLME